MLDETASANTATDAEADPQMDHQSSPPEVVDVMTAVAHPPNHDGMDLSELPPMREAILSPAQVESLFLDIEKLATEVLLMQRSTKTALASGTKATTSQQLNLGKAALLTGKVPRIQLRYRWQDKLWIDTLESKPEG